MIQLNAKGPRWSRRLFLGMGVAGIVTEFAAACRTEPIEGSETVFRHRTQHMKNQASSEGKLLARPADVVGRAPAGLQPLGLESGRDGLLYVPDDYRADRPAPLVLMLHGAGGNGHHGLAPFRPLADAAGIILLAPDSRRETWDVILGRYGPDVSFIDRALAQVFGRYKVDPNRVVIGGFSDGGTYALSLGLTNGDLFTHIVALSPGFMKPARRQGRPRLFISHGTRDQVLPINYCSRRIVPQLQGAGYDVRYREFDGPHTVPAEIALEAVDWLALGRSRKTA